MPADGVESKDIAWGYEVIIQANKDEEPQYSCEEETVVKVDAK